VAGLAEPDLGRRRVAGDEALRVGGPALDLVEPVGVEPAVLGDRPDLDRAAARLLRVTRACTSARPGSAVGIEPLAGSVPS
jgi:hypothetical protein